VDVKLEKVGTTKDGTKNLGVRGLLSKKNMADGEEVEK
jgi:hypothetical protein